VIGLTGTEIWPVKGLRKKLDGETILIGLMGISTRSYKTGGDDKASFKHSIVWHLKEIKEIKRPKNLIIFQNKLCMLCISTSFGVCAHPEEHSEEDGTAFFQQFSNFLFLFKDPYGRVF
jgi:hypothetical protein